jgi:hypothetical protein
MLLRATAEPQKSIFKEEILWLAGGICIAKSVSGRRRCLRWNDSSEILTQVFGLSGSGQRLLCDRATQKIQFISCTF